MKTICFDFDGVIHSYKSGWVSVDVIPDPPVEGIKDVLAAIHRSKDKPKIVIHSTRCSTPKGIAAIWGWLIKWDLALFIDDVVATKPPAVIYIDDRGYHFDGNTIDLINKILEILKN